MGKNIKLLLSICLVLVALVGCAASKRIQGTWRIQDAENKTGQIKLTRNKLTIDIGNSKKSYSFKQNAIGTKNGTTYYGLTLDNQSLSIIFPEKNKNKAIFMQVDSTDDYLKGKMIFAMNKTKKPNYRYYVNRYLNQ
ncbi:hypothetical protein [Latilactobacillus graminis]|uniref:Glycosyltransferase n=2 Tax=Latilactobacillus graminis TaxID=60519 RepID=A0AA89I0J0_9LACO|nr:hypothetical protein [Latilactobacillus graminis]KRM22318.1 hypothetical protein FC90_GL000919 [Latilactobacillus graminis DSM 20719]